MRFVTYNIHSFGGNDHRDNLDRITAVLKATDADVIALQEVVHPTSERAGLDPHLKRLADALNMKYYWGEAVDGFGNALLTRLPVLSHSTILLPSLARPKNMHTRCALRVEIDISSLHDGAACKPLCVYSLHLDHIDEERRMRQAEELMNHLKEDHTVLLGDFNALTRQDYDDIHWKQITDHRINSRWEAPRSDLMRRMMEDGKFTDSMRVVYERKGQYGKHPQKTKTCWAGTRIDYVLTRGFDERAIVDGKVLDDGGASDHWPVMIDLDVECLKENQ
ncbi:hypothetical protein PROFUN_10189 [Planoprotostelium fungivorum]|uniref:Endonuclease/exonuclease/phosphatase domain-containing protein n=1 Tax=Planoprotostelium fungivorum TaxID=1890364 RepID=A0A2P6MQ30_9EUKA|nr:hypothetical protein PROFUN_10189 [Planoprotostelium fungivorum]